MKKYQPPKLVAVLNITARMIFVFGIMHSVSLFWAMLEWLTQGGGKSTITLSNGLIRVRSAASIDYFLSGSGLMEWAAGIVLHVASLAGIAESAVIALSVFLLVKNSDVVKRKYRKPLNIGIVTVVLIAVVLCERVFLAEETLVALNAVFLMVIASFLLFYILTGIARALDARCQTAYNTARLASQIPSVVDDGAED